ncbi:nucleotide sugar dehydrogenase [Desulfovibrio sp. X2]|uniref:UDP-glucose dehydrogenase family protein n=1 Tax=Desulfovibrio sp. X2 TaxID=941449 RepID=UPI000358B97C|nr:UDP-glucose/GDP-mannose dehydrogenase family protein [Desulfovibrio sp. X2]EPR42333.1 nucleotide sugar dehydrogenase [Desulfovibrio sp. X2]
MNVCIVGTGYVGLVSAACLAEMGNDVVCVDVNPSVVEMLSQGHIHIFEPGLEDLVARNARDGRLRFTTDLEEGVRDALCVFLTVGTPSKPDGSCDLCYVHQVAAQIGQVMNGYKIIVDKSTVPVGTADQVREIVAAELAQRGLDIEFDVVSNPEFLKEGDAVNDFMKPDRVIVGTDSEKAARHLEALYAPYARSRDKLIMMGVKSAEMTKYAANCLLATKISFINEVANICELVGADVREVRMGIGSDHRIGYHFIYPGVGYGGSCFPKDVRALINTAKEHGYSPRLIESVDLVNSRQKLMLSNKVKNYFADQGGVKGKTLAMWGLAFKANTDDMRDAPSIDIIRDLTAEGMRIRAFDPVAGERAREIFKDNPLVEVCEQQYDALDKADALAVVTEWNQFRNPNVTRIKRLLRAPIVFDGRNLYAPSFMASEGFAYFSIGRRPTRPE